LSRSTLRIATVEAIFYEQYYVSQPGSVRQQGPAGNLEVIRDDWNNHRQIEIRMKTPREIEITFV
jgi:hypothetical protein